MAVEGLRRLNGLVPVRAGLVIDFCTNPVRTGISTYPTAIDAGWLDFNTDTNTCINDITPVLMQLSERWPK